MQSIHINADGEYAWIGGLYYKRNILFSLLQNDYIKNNYNIVVTIRKNDKELYHCFSDDVIFDLISCYGLRYKVRQTLNYLKYHTKYTFPQEENIVRNMLKVCSINWIPDFQHNIYPEYFTTKDCAQRSHLYKKIKESSSPLVLSSGSAYKDFTQFYGFKRNTYIIPFVSYIEPEIKKISNTLEVEILTRNHLNKNGYACISNQFWKHKNHIVVLKAIKLLSGQLKQNFKFVFTGYPSDNRDPEYYHTLMKLMNDDDIKEYICILGFMDRVEQLIIMKNAKFIIQPSLFEGWGTVVEDAKVLDKLIVLSDIPVHHEQMNKNCMFFNPHDPQNLAKKIIEAKNMVHQDCVEEGIKNMYLQATIYSEQFQKMLDECTF